MKKFLFGFYAFAVMSCDKAGSNIIPFHGTYIGYFHRNNSDTARVKLRFSFNTFEGQSSNEIYPAIGKGTFDQKENVLNFLDSNRWSSNFDKSLVLKGSYNYAYNDDGTVRIWKQRGSTVDEYILRMPVK